MRAHRAAGRLEPGSRPESLPEPAPHFNQDLVDAVRRELEEADQLDTVDGQVALILAERAATEGTPGLAAVAKELRVALARAVDRFEGPEDEVAWARRVRAERRREFGMDK